MGAPKGGGGVGAHHSPTAAILTLNCQEGVICAQVIPGAACMEGGTDALACNILSRWYICDDAAKFGACRPQRFEQSLFEPVIDKLMSWWNLRLNEINFEKECH